MLNSLFTYLQFKFTKELQNQHVNENEFAVFECEVSHKDIPINWYINDMKIEASSKYQVFMEQTIHRLSVNMAKPKDAGTVKAVFRDTKTSAQLTVERK